MDGKDENPISLVFSDIDGTILHYPSQIPKSPPGNQYLKLPPSSTGMKGIISSETISLIQEIRGRGAKFVLVSGMRTSTFLKRLPYLPKADAYCTEAGGRIFYPTDAGISQDNVFVVKPKGYGRASKDDLKPFGIQEDLEWRAKIEEASGEFGSPSLKELYRDPSKTKELKERDGLLWDFARHLIHKGFILDTKGYSACFRVNRKQQSSVSDDDFENLLNGTIKPFDGLASSVNLSCIDFYSELSGKKNWCARIIHNFSLCALN
jgi:hydroxymethylpyrimidine pyrophosphatase-like HAD family hydrolase